MASAGTRAHLLPAALTLSAGIAVFSIQDAIMKGLSGAYPVTEAVAIRTAASLPFVLVLLHRAGGRKAPRSALPALLFRSGLMFVAYIGYYLALPAMPLASAVALWFVGPLFIAALSGPITGERVGAAVWASIGIGLCGVLVMLRPGGGLATWAVVYPIVSALTYGIAQLLARRLRDWSAPEMSFYQTSVYGIAALLLAVAVMPLAGAAGDDPSLDFLTRAWAMPTPRDLALLVSCGPIMAVGATMLTHAYRVAGGAVSPFEYTALLWATIWGFLLWDEVPDAGAIVGAALIVGSGMYAAARTG